MKRYNEDLFQDTAMTFGEHLEELRSCLFKALIGLLFGFLIGLVFGNRIVLAFEEPLKRALTEFYRTKAQKSVAERYPELSDELISTIVKHNLIPEQVLIEPGALQAGGTPQPAYYRLSAEHLKDPKSLAAKLSSAAAQTSPVAERVRSLMRREDRELVDRLADSTELPEEEVRKLAAALDRLLPQRELYDKDVFAKAAADDHVKRLIERQQELSEGRELLRLNWLLLSSEFPDEIVYPRPDLKPIFIWRPAAEDERVQPQSLGVQEPFMIYMKVSLLAGAVIASPWIFIQIWAFIAAGLYPHEKHYVHTFLPFSLGLFLAGSAMAFFFVFDPVLKFLFGFNQWLGINPDPKIGDWLSFVLFIPLGFGISFQLPLVMLFLQRIGVFDVPTYIEKWRIAILAIFIISAVLTPADPYTIWFMAAPLTVLYFGGIALCKWLPGGRNPFEESGQRLRGD